VHVPEGRADEEADGLPEGRGSPEHRRDSSHGPWSGSRRRGRGAARQARPVNPTRAKKLDNIRSSTKELTVKLDAARRLTLEEALEFINPDELVEVTPGSIRLRKRVLDDGERRRLAKREG